MIEQLTYIIGAVKICAKVTLVFSPIIFLLTGLMFWYDITYGFQRRFYGN